jgi:antitoxin component YwqK of YwqJK toxin-antitoxin module
MKYIYTLLVAVSFGIIGCTNEEEQTKETKKVENLVEIKDGIYTEWYPGKKQIKYRGGQDNEKRRHGVWTFYAETGTELSVTMYEHGLRTGHTVVKYPNGRLHYRGEYLNDKTVGVWTTYDEKGELISEKDFGYPAN